MGKLVKALESELDTESFEILKEIKKITGKSSTEIISILLKLSIPS